MMRTCMLAIAQHVDVTGEQRDQFEYGVENRKLVSKIIRTHLRLF